jgi:acetyltransferase
MRLIGPNCLGVMVPTTGMNATFASAMARPGGVAFLSQSGALLTAILDWSHLEHVGFSAFVSVGSMLDVGWGDLISYFGADPKTQSILLYMESIGDARAFLSAAREVALRKPIIVIKAGRTEQAAKAAASHTGTLTGSDEVLTAAFRRTGVLRVEAIADLFYMAEVLAKQPRPKGRRLTILTNAGGPGVLATDALVSGGGELAALSEATTAALDAFLPPHWSRGNPIDLLGDADADRFARALEVAVADEGSDGLLVTMVPVGTASPTRVAEALRPYAHAGKPVLASWMGGAEMAAGVQLLNQSGIPTFAYPDTAARLFNYMGRYSYNLEALYETPTLRDDPTGVDLERAGRIVDGARAAGRTLLTEAESKGLLAAYGIPTVETHVAASADEAVAHAEAIGYPVVLKLHSFTVTHKTDVGGVQLDLPDEAAVRRAYDAIRAGLEKAGHPDAFDGVTVQPMVRLGGYELILGSSPDPQFGPVLLFGSGGSLVEVYRDRALGLPPLTTTLARRMMEQTRIYEALGGVRGRAPVDHAALEALMVRFSHLVVEQPFVREIDINPLLASPEGLLALDARVVLYGPEVEEGNLPRLAIRPYPRQYVGDFTLRDGTAVTIRPIRPEDEPLMVGFHEALSEESVYLRYAGVMKLSRRVAHDRLSRLCFIDYDREMALVAVRRDDADGRESLLGVGRLAQLHGTRDGEFALLVRDDVQGQGLGSELLRRLVAVGRDEGLARIVGDILPENRAMQAVARALGFEVHHRPGEALAQAVRVLPA